MNIIDPTSLNDLLAESIEIAHKMESELGDEADTGAAEAAFKALKEGYIKMDNPEALAQRWRPADFEAKGITLSDPVKKTMQGKKGYAFYLIPIPVLMHPGRGAEYHLLESEFSFSVKPKERPLSIRNIFPISLWKPEFQFPLPASLPAREWG